VLRKTGGEGNAFGNFFRTRRQKLELGFARAGRCLLWTRRDSPNGRPFSADLVELLTITATRRRTRRWQALALALRPGMVDGEIARTKIAV